MAIVGSEFLDMARECLSSGSTSEVMCRVSVSRGYYGVYHVALAYADSISIPPVSATAGRTHEKLRLYYENFFGTDRSATLAHRHIGYRLKQLHDARVIADYKVDETVSYIMAEAQVESCTQLIERIDSLKATKAA